MNIGGKFIAGLRDSMSNSRTRLSAVRSKRNDFLRQYVGSHYSQHGAQHEVPINLLAQDVNVYVRNLVAKNPKVLATSQSMELKADAFNFELAMNHLLKEIRFSKTHSRVIKDAMFGMGIVKTGIAPVDIVEIGGILHDVGQPYIDRVSLDDWVHDVDARSQEEFAYCGDRFRRPIDLLQESSLYKNVDKISESQETHYDEDGGEKSTSLSRGEEGVRSGEFRKYVDLWEVYLPAENVILTFPVGGGPVIREEEWEGPEVGPYHLLSLIEVPDQVLPLPPVALIYDIHMMANRIYRKLGRQAERQKSFLGVSSQSNEDGERVVNVNDGEAIKLNYPEGVKEYSTGGISQENMAFFIDLFGRNDYMGGNITALGGFGAMSDTVGQDEMMTRNASKLIQDFQDSVHEFTTDLMRSAGWYLWHDPFIEFPLVKRVPGTEIEIPISWTPEDRESDFYEYNIEIVPHSMENDSPGQKLNTIGMVWDRFIAPYMEFYMQQGHQPNLQGLLENVSRYAGMDELQEIMTFGQPPGPGTPFTVPAGGDRQRSPAVTRRENVRINRSAGTPMGRDKAMMQTLLGGGVQPSEMAQVGGIN